jgi:hypothetical protein
MKFESVWHRSFPSLAVAGAFVALAACASEDPVSDEGGQEPVASMEKDSGAPPPPPEDLPSFEMTPTALPAGMEAEKYGYIDPKGVVPKVLLTKTLAFFDANIAKIKNKKFITVVDFAKHSGKKRFFVINMTSGVVTQDVVAHGSGSDANNDGIAEKFSNLSGSNASSLGFYLTAEVYTGAHGRSLRLDGISPTNSNARPRAVVIHTADYVADTRAQQGRSWGCLVLSSNRKDAIVDDVRDGSLIYAGLSTTP